MFQCIILSCLPFCLTFIIDSIFGLLLAIAKPSSARTLITGSQSGSSSFNTAFYPGSPVLLLPESISFDTGSAAIANVSVTLSPPVTGTMEGISLSTNGSFFFGGDVFILISW